MKIRLYYWIEVIDRDGKRVRKTRRRICHSLLKAYIGLLLVQRSTDNRNIVGTDGNVKIVPPSHANFKSIAAAGEDHIGIVVGTGGTAVAASDYAMETLIIHGTGADQLEYGLASIGNGNFIAPVFSGSSGSFRMNRQFMNNSGGDIIVKEIGIYSAARVGAGLDYFCTARDVLASSETIADGHGIVVSYEFKVTVP